MENSTIIINETTFVTKPKILKEGNKETGAYHTCEGCYFKNDRDCPALICEDSILIKA